MEQECLPVKIKSESSVRVFVIWDIEDLVSLDTDDRGIFVLLCLSRNSIYSLSNCRYLDLIPMKTYYVKSKHLKRSEDLRLSGRSHDIVFMHWLR
jgi:hypothetical protein